MAVEYLNRTVPAPNTAALQYTLPNSHTFPQLITEHSGMQHCSNRNDCDRSQRMKSLLNYKQFCY